MRRAAALGQSVVAGVGEIVTVGKDVSLRERLYKQETHHTQTHTHVTLIRITQEIIRMNRQVITSISW